jgi:hypothetical protein
MENGNKKSVEEEAYRAEIRERYANGAPSKRNKRFKKLLGLIVMFVVAISAIIYGIFNFGGSTYSSEASNRDEQPKEIAEEKVSLDKLTKGFNDNYISPQITFNLTFANNTDKDIRGFEGIVTFFDVFDNEIEALRLSYDQGLQARYEVTLEKAVDYNQFRDASIKLKEIEEKNLKYKWKVTTILYDDGTKETY